MRDFNSAYVACGVNSRLRRLASATGYDRTPLKADMVFTAPTVTSTHARFPQ